MKFTLRNSLMGLFGLMLALSVAQGIVTLTKLDAIDGKTSALLDNAIPSMNEANVINGTVVHLDDGYSVFKQRLDLPVF